MEFIIDFYKSLDTLNLIIFWGIIIVIILLLIFSFILINKNKKLKKIVASKIKTEEELPIKVNETEIQKEENIRNYKSTNSEISQNNEQENLILPNIPELPKEEIISKPIETERKFIAEEHVIEYNKDAFVLSNIKKTNENQENKQTNEINYKNSSSKNFEIPNKPYQRNVLREMSLSQTSPIGITKPINKEEKKIEMAKDLEQSLNENQEELTREITRERNMKENEVIKKELYKIEDSSIRKTEIMNNNKTILSENKEMIKEEKQKLPSESLDNKYNEDSYSNKLVNNIQTTTEKIKVDNIPNQRTIYEEPKKENTKQNNPTSVNQEFIPPQVRELLNNTPAKETVTKSSSEKYLEEVSRKLAAAEIPDEIERTDYELEQEENAIISYKELMEKKDSIQTIDEEEAIISIEELMNHNINKQENKEETKEDNKLYNLTDDEENDNFIKELKQFRNDL